MSVRLKQDKSEALGDLKRFTAFEAAGAPRHRWYLFKEGFSRDLVERAITDTGCDTDAVIVDPFCGSGTTPLTAAIGGYSCEGIEVNPFLKFVSETKLNSCSERNFDRVANGALEGMKSRKHARLEKFSTFSEKSEQGLNADKWLFNSSVLRAFDGAWSSVESFSKQERNLVRLCLINAAMDVCNARKDGKCLRYKKDWKEKGYDKKAFLSALENRFEEIREDIGATSIGDVCSQLTNNDSRSKLITQPFDLCVTSPPYLNSFDYTDIYRPELFLGGFVKNLEELRHLRLKTVRSHVQVNWKKPEMDSFGLNYSESMKEILKVSDHLWDKRIPIMIQAYFEDMLHVLKNLRRQAKPKSTIWLVVSTSAYAGVEVPVDLIIADLAKQSGWFLREVSILRYMRRVASQQWSKLSDNKQGEKPYLRESVVILDTEKRTAFF